MRLRRLYALLGAAWGLLPGVFAAVGTVGFAFGASWLFLFGDDRWPEAVGPLILGLAGGVGVSVVAAGGWVGHRLGSRYEAAGRDGQRAARRRAHAWAWSWAATVAALLALSTISALRSGSERETAAERERRYAALDDALHRIDRVEAAAGPASTRIATIHLTGSREGEYRLDWTLDERTYRTVLDEGTREMSLAGGAERLELSFDLEALRDRYRERVLSGPGAILVEEDFRLRLTLTPRLTEAERRAIPAREVHNLELGESELIARAVGAIPVRFDIR